MEKFAKRKRAFFKFGLLIFNLIFFSQPLFAQFLFEPSDEIFFTNQELQFKLLIPNVSASAVQMELPKFPKGVVFNLSRCEDYIFSKEYADEYSRDFLKERGAKIELTFTFENTGDFTLPPITLYINGYRMNAYFKTVKIEQNKKMISPRLVVRFENGQTILGGEQGAKKISLAVGKPTHFTVYIQYAEKIQHFSCAIPKDSILKELNRYEFVAPNDFSHERIPLARFEWTPLAEGKTAFPEIRLVATAYSGRNVTPAAPQCAVEIVGAKNALAKKAEKNEKPVFESAFLQETEEEQIPPPTAEQLAKIAELRSVERHSLFQNKIRVQRTTSEKELGIQNSQNEPSVPLFKFFLVLFWLCVAAVLALYFWHKKKFATLAAAFAITFAAFALSLYRPVSKQHGIVIGGFLSPVPEDSALTRTLASEGVRVLVSQEIDGWYYIEYNESAGWIKKENVVMIK